MTPLTWLALAGAIAVSALPRPVVVRAGGLAGDGRLAAGRLIGGARVPVGRGRLTIGAAGAVGAAVLGAVWWRGGAALTVAACAVPAVAVVFLRDLVRDRRQLARHRDLLTATRVLAGELNAGAGPAAALSAAAATSRYAEIVFGGAAQAQRDGGDGAAALGEVAGGEAALGEAAGEEGAGDGPAVRGLAAAWGLAATTGAPLAEVIERVSADLTAADTRRRAVTVALAGPRSSAVLLSALPAVGIALGAAMGARPLEFLLADPIGRVLCCVGVLLDVAGLLWIRRILRRAQSP